MFYMLLIVLLFIYVYPRQIPFPYYITFMSFNNNTTDPKTGAGNAHYSGAPEFTGSESLFFSM